MSPNLLTASEASRLIANRQLSSEELVRACLARIDAREMSVSAFAHLDPELAIREARERDRSEWRGPLHGIPLALKDIIDTRDMPTAGGSRALAGHRPLLDAACVAAARAAGAVILGKTVTTEFAGRHPGPTSHPHNRAHSPGGSSSGSAAAVADFMVPLALGSQTGGSTIRPAAYCGIHGYKPSFGLLSLAGVHHLAENFDTLGLLARSTEDLVLLRNALLGPDAWGPSGASDASRASNASSASASAEVSTHPPRIGLCRSPHWDRAAPAVRQALEDAAAQLEKAGASVREHELPAEFSGLEEPVWSVIFFETARALLPVLQHAPENLAGGTLEMIRKGRAVRYEDYVDTMRRLDRLRVQLDDWFGDLDAVLTPSAIDEAPRGLEDTGPTTFNYLWHVSYVPAITVPFSLGPAGLPIGVQLVARRRDDDRLLRTAQWCARALGADSGGTPR